MAFPPAKEPATELGRLRVLSSTAGVRVSPMQLGNMSLGSAWGALLGGITKEEVFELYDAYAAAGGNFIDTANNYHNEESETWLGEWMVSRQNRESMVVATKFSFDHKSYANGNTAPNRFGNHRRSLYLSVKDSLEKLQTDYIDILYVHFWDYTTSIKELMDSLHLLVQERKVLYLGISDTPAWTVAAANTYANDYGKTPFSIYQGWWGILNRDFEREILPMARHFGMALAPFGAVGRGKLQSVKAMEERKERGESVRGGNQTPEEIAVSKALSKVAAELGIESVTAVAIAYVLHKAPNVFPIIGGRKIEQLHDNIQALSLTLSEKQIKELEAVQPFDIGFPTSFIGADPNVTGISPPLLAASAPMSWPNARK